MMVRVKPLAVPPLWLSRCLSLQESTWWGVMVCTKWHLSAIGTQLIWSPHQASISVILIHTVNVSSELKIAGVVCSKTHFIDHLIRCLGAGGRITAGVLENGFLLSSSCNKSKVALVKWPKSQKTRLSTSSSGFSIPASFLENKVWSETPSPSLENPFYFHGDSHQGRVWCQGLRGSVREGCDEANGYQHSIMPGKKLNFQYLKNTQLCTLGAIDNLCKQTEFRYEGRINLYRKYTSGLCKLRSTYVCVQDLKKSRTTVPKTVFTGMKASTNSSTVIVPDGVEACSVYAKMSKCFFV